MATHEEGRFAGEGGVEIYWQAWLPEGEPRAVIVLAHGASEHSGRYAWTGEQLGARGYAVYAIDHRGHGQSAGGRAVIDRMRNAVEDLHTLVERAAGAHRRRALADDRRLPRRRHQVQAADARDARDRRSPRADRGKRDGRRPGRLGGQDLQALRRPLPRDPERARAPAGGRRHRRL